MKFCLLALFIFSLNLSANDDCNDKLIEKLEKEYKKSKTVRGVPLEQYQWDILPGGIFFYKLKSKNGTYSVYILEDRQKGSATFSSENPFRMNGKISPRICNTFSSPRSDGEKKIVEELKNNLEQEEH